MFHHSIQQSNTGFWNEQLKTTETSFSSDLQLSQTHKKVFGTMASLLQMLFSPLPVEISPARDMTHICDHSCYYLLAKVVVHYYLHITRNMHSISNFKKFLVFHVSLAVDLDIPSSYKKSCFPHIQHLSQCALTIGLFH